MTLRQCDIIHSISIESRNFELETLRLELIIKFQIYLNDSNGTAQSFQTTDLGIDGTVVSM